MVKHRQLARQVGAFDEFSLESSADLDLKMTYSAGTTFVFGSWICEAGGDGKLRTRLREEKEFDDKNNPIEQELAEKMMKLLALNPTRKGEESGYEIDSEKEMEYDSDLDKEMKRNSDSDKKMEHNSDSDKKMEHDSNSDKEMEHNPNSDAIFKTKEPHLIGLKDTTMIVKEYNPYNPKKNSRTYGLYNTASIYQHFTQDKMNSARKILLEGAQEGMIMTVTP